MSYKSLCVHDAVSQNRKSSIRNRSRVNAWRKGSPPTSNDGRRDCARDGTWTSRNSQSYRNGRPDSGPSVRHSASARTYHVSVTDVEVVAGDWCSADALDVRPWRPYRSGVGRDHPGSSGGGIYATALPGRRCGLENCSELPLW